MKRGPDFAIISRIEVGVRKPGYTRQMSMVKFSWGVFSGMDNLLLVKIWGEYVGARKGEGSHAGPLDRRKEEKRGQPVMLGGW